MRTLWVSPLSVAAPSLVGPVPRGDVLYDRRSLIAPIAVLIPAKPKFRLSKFSLAGGLLALAKCHHEFIGAQLYEATVVRLSALPVPRC